jgi:hypothetical protein
MANNTGLSVERVVLLNKLKDKVKEMPKLVKEYKADQDAYYKEVNAWVEETIKDATNIKEINARQYREEFVHIEFTPKALKTKPKYTGPERPDYSDYGMDSALRELNNAINILEMSNSENVGVTMMNKVSRFL